MSGTARDREAAQRLEDKKRLAEAINSGQMPLFEGFSAPNEPVAPAAPKDVDDFEPCTFFFYGTLVDPDVLKAVAFLGEPPDLSSAWVEGFEVYMWNHTYPALVQSDASRDRITGKAWRATSMAQCLALQAYETAAYEGCDCVIHLASGETVKGLTFCWARDPQSSQLSKGTFDLDAWKKSLKGPAF
ncbi:hypothetical protein HIM_00086 [Hirsutella minnesotensis 3608]|nr:hypothetical protein HIM_00086 [Hirsutella minnesotensis 3608]